MEHILRLQLLEPEHTVAAETNGGGSSCSHMGCSFYIADGYIDR